MRSFELVLFRHGDKLLNPPSDPALSPVGRVKAETFAQRLGNDFSLPSVLWSSPKLRARQSFAPAAEKFSLPLKESPLLLEAQSDETVLHFENRIKKFIASLAGSSDPIHYACSHYDWVLRFSELGLGSKIHNHPQCMHWRPFQFVHFKMIIAPSESLWDAEVIQSGAIEPKGN